MYIYSSRHWGGSHVPDMIVYRVVPSKTVLANIEPQIDVSDKVHVLYISAKKMDSDRGDRRIFVGLLWFFSSVSQPHTPHPVQNTPDTRQPFVLSQSGRLERPRIFPAFRSGVRHGDG